MVGRRASSTLFPYTTLFRSGPGLGARRRVVSRDGGLGAVGRPDVVPPRRPGPDRKSTRLNSSHLVISYAVFCLKIKTNTSAVYGETLPQMRLAKIGRAPVLA